MGEAELRLIQLGANLMIIGMNHCASLSLYQAGEQKNLAKHGSASQITTCKVYFI